MDQNDPFGLNFGRKEASLRGSVRAQARSEGALNSRYTEVISSWIFFRCYVGWDG
jgi:hypothetical protein